MSESQLSLERRTDVGFVNIRGDVRSTPLVTAVREVCELELPVEANTVQGEERRLCWLGPDEWLLCGNSSEIATMAHDLGARLQGEHVAINDLSGGQVSFRLSGEHGRELLAKGCTLDLHSSIFAPGACAQTGLAKAAVLMIPAASEAAIEIVVRRSFADYVWQWLLQAGREYGIEVA